MPSLVQRLRQRKLIQWAVAYLAGAWAILEAMGFAAERFGWPEILLKALTLLAVVGFFVTLVLAWYHGEQGRQRVSGPELLMIALLLVVAGGVLAMLRPERRDVASMELPADTEPESDAALLRRLPGLAVLPLDNRSSAEEDQYFAEGIYDDLLTRLQRIPGLRVISRTSAETYRGTDKPIPTIGRELNVDYLLEGGVQRVGETVHITVQLIDAPNDRHLWASTYDRELAPEQMLDVQSDIVRTVSQELGIALIEQEQERAALGSTRDLEAWNLYARALDATSRRDGEAAERLLLAATERDSTFVGALFRLVRLAGERYMFLGLRSPERAQAARAAAERAVAIDPGSPDAQMAMGIYLYRIERDWEGALEWMGRAGETLRGDYLYQYYRGLTERRMGQWQQSVASLEAAISLSPILNNVRRELAGTLMHMRRHDDAERVIAQILAEEPDERRNHSARYDLEWRRSGDTTPWAATVERFDLPFDRWELEMVRDDPAGALAALDQAPDVWFSTTYWYPRSMLAGMARERSGDAAAAGASYREAAAILEPLAAAEPDDERYHAALGLTYAGLGRRDDALREARRAVEILPLERDAVDGPSHLFTLAAVLARFGEADEAVSILERLLTVPSRYSAPVLREHYLLRPLWNEPSFQDLLERQPGRVF